MLVKDSWYVMFCNSIFCYHTSVQFWQFFARERYWGPRVRLARGPTPLDARGSPTRSETVRRWLSVVSSACDRINRISNVVLTRSEVPSLKADSVPSPANYSQLVLSYRSQLCHCQVVLLQTRSSGAGFTLCEAPPCPVYYD